jgi:hypothetical protein
MRLRQTLVWVAALVCALPAAARAQCVVATDPGYGFEPAKAIAIGGGPLYAAARESRYLKSLRGPEGETVAFERRGSMPLPGSLESGQTTILDVYDVRYGDRAVTMYLNVYAFDLPQAPVGFTCAQSLSAALGPPPLDFLAAAPQVQALALEQGPTLELPLVPLDGGLAGFPYGAVFDYYRMLALRARDAASRNIGHLGLPPPGMGGAIMVIAAYPLPCEGGDPIEPTSVDILANGKTPVQRGPEILRGPALANMLPGAELPDNSAGFVFALGMPHLRPGDQVRITYESSPCPSAPPREIVLPVVFAAPQLVTNPLPKFPPGITEPDPTVFLQVVVDTDGQYQMPLVLAGPERLRLPAMDAIRTWRSSPARVNGVPVATLTTLRVVFER